MIKLEQLPQVAEETLGGLRADLSLLYRPAQKPRAGFTRQGRALAFALSLVLALSLGALTLSHQGALPMPQVLHQQAGQTAPLPQGARTSADLPQGSLVLSQEERPTYKGVWARGSGGNFPLIRLDGRYYRLLNAPSDVQSLAGSQLGQVALLTDEPALDSSGDTLSSVVPAGEGVFSVSGTGGTVVAARVEGRMRAFQRVSFAGSALLGGESLQNTLPSGASALQLSGLGTVSDPAKVSQLMDILLHQSAYQGSQLKESRQALLVQYPNGLVLQMAVSGSSLSACGTWHCPAFFEAFQEAMN